MVAIVILHEDLTVPVAALLTHLPTMRSYCQPLLRLLTAMLLAAPAFAQPLAPQHDDGRSLYEQRRTDLRSALRGQPGELGAQPWQLSPEERAAMRQQISREGQRGTPRDGDRRGDRRR